MHTESAELLLCCLLWAHRGQEAALTEYEDQVLALIPEHDGAVVSRVIGDGADGHPLEVQLYRFASPASVDGYLADPRRTALAAVRDAVVARTELFPVRSA